MGNAWGHIFMSNRSTGEDCQVPEFLVRFPSMKWSNSLNESAAAVHLRKFWADGNNSNEEMEIWNYVGVNVFKV